MCSSQTIELNPFNTSSWLNAISTNFATFSLRAHLPDLTYTHYKMARGQQKIQSQQKNAKRQADLKKAGNDNRAAAAVKLTVVCKTCKVRSLKAIDR